MGLTEELKKYGLSEKEAKVYLGLLKIGVATVNEIAEECDLVRTTTYDVLKSLKEKGIVSLMIKNKTYFFEPASPKKLMQMLDEKKRGLESIMPELNELKTFIPEKSRAEVFEGKEGLKTVFQILLSKKQTLLAYANNSKMFEILPYFAPAFIKQRIKAKIPLKIISEPSDITFKELKAKDKKEFRETRILEDLKNTSIHEYIGDEFIAILGSRADKPLAVVIYHKDFVEQQKILFEALWKLAKK